MKKRRKGILRTIFWASNLLIVAFLSGCLGSNQSALDPWLENHDAVVIMFLTPDCPLAQNYSRPFLDLHADFQDTSLAFVGVLPGTLYSDEEINEYKEKFYFDLPIIEDADFTITNEYQPEVTPEFILVSGDQVLYQGALDNWMTGLGQYRKRPTEFYLRRAIEQWKENKPITTAETEAYGCFIEYP
jgi:hypothetical protein